MLMVRTISLLVLGSRYIRQVLTEFFELDIQVKTKQASHSVDEYHDVLRLVIATPVILLSLTNYHILWS